MMELKARLQKMHGNRVVLDIEASFASGRLHTILGPNGSGKTTLLRLLSGVKSPSENSRIQYYQDGHEITPDQDFLRGTVLTPDRNGLFNDTVQNNCGFGLAVRGKEKQEINETVEQCLRAEKLWDMRKENALHLSNGEAQRLCLAMAIAVNPKIILLDEPTASLDPENAAMVEEIILNMKSDGRIILLVTHNLFQARRLADTVSFLYNGKVLESAPAKDFFENPQTPEAQRFLSGSLVY